MVPLFHCRTYIMTLSIGLLWLIGTFIRAQSVERVGEDQVTVQAEGVTLGALLREIAEVVPIEKLLIDPSVEDKPVQIKLDNVSFSEALTRILEAAGVNYAIQGGNERPYRVFAGSPTEADAPPKREATGNAHLDRHPDTQSVAIVAALLASGFLVGCTLANGHGIGKNPTAPAGRYRDENR